MSTEERGRRALQVLAEHTRCAEGFLYLLDERARPQLKATLGGAGPSPELASWVERRLACELEDESTQMGDDDGQPEQGSLSDVFETDERHYRLQVLVASGARAHGVIGAAVLAGEGSAPVPCPAEVLGSVGYHLQRALSQRASLESV